MANCWITANGQSLVAEVPVDRQDVLIADEQRMLNGQLRRAYRATKKRLRYGRSDLTEAERATWIAAHPFTTSYSHTDELGVTRTVVTISRIDTLEWMAPVTPGSLSTTGAAYYRVEVEIEEV